MRRARTAFLTVLALGGLAGTASAHEAVTAQAPSDPINDLFALGQGFGQSPARVATAKRAEPPLEATPRAQCAPGDRTEPGIQGRVPAGSATNGFACNISLVSQQGNSGGFKVLRYTDSQGHDCAFYDTALLFPSNALHPEGSSLGVAVVDMTDPTNPVLTDSLVQQPMLSPHESLNLNPKRGLVAAASGNFATAPGLVSIYDASGDCRHPVHQSTLPVARIGHESGFAPDGRTFYVAGTAEPGITAVDVTDPKDPHAIWHGNVASHGMTISDDGNRAYIADPGGGQMLTLDVSEIQARKPNPEAREVSRLTWDKVSIPQNAIPFTRAGKPYVLEFDEYSAGTTGRGDRDAVGAGRIIDISNETEPKVVSNLRLQVNQPEDHAAAARDPGAQSPEGYAAHYCSPSTQVDPTVVACSFIASGLRVFDISNLSAPREIAYFVAPTTPEPENFGQPSNVAMSKPVIVPERREIWYTDGGKGLFALRVSADVWPSDSTRCLSRKLRVSAGGVGRIRVGAKRSKVLSVAGVSPTKVTKNSLRYCVKGGGRVLAALDSRGRVTAVFSTAKKHRGKGVATGTTRRSAAKRFRRAVRLRPSLTVLYRGRLAAGVKSGRVRFVGAVDRKRARSPRALRAELRRVGL